MLWRAFIFAMGHLCIEPQPDFCTLRTGTVHTAGHMRALHNVDFLIRLWYFHAYVYNPSGERGWRRSSGYWHVPTRRATSWGDLSIVSQPLSLLSPHTSLPVSVFCSLPPSPLTLFLRPSDPLSGRLSLPRSSLSPPRPLPISPSSIFPIWNKMLSICFVILDMNLVLS